MFGKALAAFGERTDVHADSLPVAAAQPPTAAEPTSGKWNCGKCSNANDAGATTCDLCSAPRYASAGVPSQAVMLAGRPQFSALGATPVMPITSRNQVIQQPQQKYQQQQQQNAQFQMQQQAQPPRVVAAVAAMHAPAAAAAAENCSKVMFVLGFFIPLLALYVLL